MNISKTEVKEKKWKKIFWKYDRELWSSIKKSTDYLLLALDPTAPNFKPLNIWKKKIATNGNSDIGKNIDIRLSVQHVSELKKKEPLQLYTVMSYGFVLKYNSTNRRLEQRKEKGP